MYIQFIFLNRYSFALCSDIMGAAASSEAALRAALVTAIHPPADHKRSVPPGLI